MALLRLVVKTDGRLIDGPITGGYTSPMSLEMAFGLIGGIIFLGLIGSLTFDKTGVPEPLILMVIGLLIGPVLKWVPSEALAPAAPLFGTLALIFLTNLYTTVGVFLLRKADKGASLLTAGILR